MTKKDVKCRHKLRHLIRVFIAHDSKDSNNMKLGCLINHEVNIEAPVVTQDKITRCLFSKCQRCL